MIKFQPSIAVLLVVSLASAGAAAEPAPKRQATVTSCPVTALPWDGTLIAGPFAPAPTYYYARAVWVITPSEMAASRFPNGAVPTAIGFRFLSAPGVAASGYLKVYLENTSDTSNNKSTDWSTAITGMTLVHYDATSLPGSAGTFDIPFSGTGISSFTYTGGGLYVAFDWWFQGPTAPTEIACNIALDQGVKSAEASGGFPPTLDSGWYFRPETRLTPSTATALNDVSVDYVIAPGSVPQPLVGPQTVQAVVSNHGLNAMNNLPVTLDLTGAQTLTDTQTVVGPLAACGGQAIVTFNPFPLTAVGGDTVTVSVPSDDFDDNNSKSRPMDATFNLYSHKHPGTTAANAKLTPWVWDVGEPDFVAKFTTTAAAKVSTVNLEFFTTSSATYKVDIYPESSPGSGVPGLTPIYEDAVTRTNNTAGPVVITLPTPVAVGPGTFFAGVREINGDPIPISYDIEIPIRSATFYRGNPHPPWTDFSPTLNFKLNIGVTLIQCTTTPDCDDNNVCTDDVCVNSLCVHTDSKTTSCDGNSCSTPDRCVNGTCIPGPNPCNDDNACTIDNCDAQGQCSYVARDCNDNNPCTTDSCDPSTGCAHVNNTLPCSDNNPCTTADQCANGVCVPGAYNTGPCSDGNPCTLGDHCANGSCIPGSNALPAPFSICNGGGMSIPAVGAASPYPFTITVTGQPSTVCSVTVELDDLAHTNPDDIDILLARSSGANAMIMSDAGGTADIANVNLILSDAATSSLPDSAKLVSGTYKPTNYEPGDTMPAPAPAPSGGSALSAFKGTNPNGDWNLWAADDRNLDSGSLRAFCLSIVAICVADSECVDDGNPCTDDGCVNGVCAHTNNANACDDGNACTANDVCTGGVCVGTPAVPPEIAGVFASSDKTTFSWSTAASASRYDVLRGALSAFPAGPGGNDETCFDDLGGTSVSDPTVPPQGLGFWYLARGENSCGKGTFGVQSSGSPRTTTTCP